MTEDLPPFLVAHTPAPGTHEWHSLRNHSIAVANLAASFAEPFHAADTAHMLGLVHDVGKARDAFQQRLLLAARHPDARLSRVQHKDVGAILIGSDWLGQILYGHHGGIPDSADFTTVKRAAVENEQAELTAIWNRYWHLDLPMPTGLPAIPAGIPVGSTSHEFYLRMLYSCLVDADALDTELHWTPDQNAIRATPTPPIQSYLNRFLADQTALQAATAAAGLADAPVNLARNAVYDACLQKASLPPGFFRLTVPTGGGKTRSATAFALQHAVAHDLRRVIYAVPFLSITDQTVAVLSDAFGADHPILEHHSAAHRHHDDGSTLTDADMWGRLATENWDAPVIVTTTVQLYESLFANRPSRCRKLHNIVNSVIVIDEFQTVPEHLRAAIFDTLAELVHRYGVTVVLSTATQPVMDTIEPELEARGRTPVELAPDPAAMFRTLERVTYHWPALTGAWSWEQVAETMSRHDQCLTIVNTIADAQTLFGMLDDPDAIHLSTRMIGRHRLRAIQRIKDRLNRGLPCRVVSTQLVEAGVDIDFPVVLRAFGPLSSIIQAAGRCNREGRLHRGEVIVFEPEAGGTPPGAYHHASSETRTTLESGHTDLNDPETIRIYFARFFQRNDPDAKGIQPKRRRLDFRSVADAFHVIEDDTVGVIVARSLPAEDAALADQALNAVKDSIRYRAGLRSAFRNAQPFIVNIRLSRLSSYQANGLVTELAPGIYEWTGSYHPKLGITEDRIDPAVLFV